MLLSDFGMALDELADKHDVQFVIAAGNYEDILFRTSAQDWTKRPINAPQIQSEV